MPELPHAAGEVISYIEMCQAWSASLQKGMNFHLRPDRSVILMSRRSNAPYKDHIEEDGRVLIYEGHDVSRTLQTPDPKSVDQPRATTSGRLTQNGLFENAASQAKCGKSPAEIVAVYEKIHAGVWAFNGLFRLADAGTESDGKRNVFKFRLELMESKSESQQYLATDLIHNRLIPSAVKTGSLAKRPRAMRVVRIKRESAFRPRPSVFQGWVVSHCAKHSASVREAQPIKGCHNPIAIR